MVNEPIGETKKQQDAWELYATERFLAGLILGLSIGVCVGALLPDVVRWILGS